MHQDRLIIAETKDITDRFEAVEFTELVHLFKYYEASFMSLWSTFDKCSHNPPSGKCFTSLNQKEIKSKAVSNVPQFWLQKILPKFILFLLYSYIIILINISYIKHNIMIYYYYMLDLESILINLK